MITIPGTSDHHHLEFVITSLERLITIPGMRTPVLLVEQQRGLLALLKSLHQTRPGPLVTEKWEPFVLLRFFS